MPFDLQYMKSEVIKCSSWQQTPLLACLGRRISLTSKSPEHLPGNKHGAWLNYSSPIHTYLFESIPLTHTHVCLRLFPQSRMCNKTEPDGGACGLKEDWEKWCAVQIMQHFKNMGSWFPLIESWAELFLPPLSCCCFTRGVCTIVRVLLWQLSKTCIHTIYIMFTLAEKHTLCAAA